MAMENEDKIMEETGKASQGGAVAPNALGSEETSEAPVSEVTSGVEETTPTEEPATEVPTVEEPAGTSEAEEVVERLSGREKLLDRFKKAHEDYQGDPTDDDLYGYADGVFGERDELQGRYDALNNSNEELARVISEEPSVARFIGMIANGAHPMYAVGKCFGDLVDTLDDENLEELERGRDERKARSDEIRGNFETYGSTLQGYLDENGLSEEDGRRINDAILDIAEALTMGRIDRDVIDSVYKGLDYDNKRSDELEAAKLAGKNEAIDEVKEKRAGGTGGVAGTLPPDVMQQRTSAPVANKFPEREKVMSLSEAVRRQEGDKR